MSDADKRTVSTDALETLGNLIGPNEKRDAIHLAVIPCLAGEFLRPGEHVEIHSATERAFACAPGEGVGVVDPFLVRAVKTDERFWLVIYPRTIHSLRHVWTHPAFPDEVAPKTVGMQFSRDDSRAFLELVAEKLGVTLEDVERMSSDGCFRTDIDGDRSVPPTFWEHFENWTGRKVPEFERVDYFRCGC